MTVRHLDPVTLRRWLLDGGEIALLDLRGPAAFQAGHLLLAVNLPLEDLERESIARLVPRPATRIVLCDDDGGQAEAGAARLSGWGYGDLALLDGGIAAWEDLDFQLFQGTYTVNNAFAFFLERSFATPSLTADQLAEKLARGEAPLIVDSRPAPEFFAGSIPGAVNLPLAELVYRLPDLLPSPATPVVVNCGGKARAVLGGQALRNAGVPNPVSALEHGTMGWDLIGQDLARGARSPLQAPSPQALAWSKSVGQASAEQFAVPSIGLDTLRAWQDDPARSLYLIDVRSRAEFHAGHLLGARWVSGGELVGLTEDHMATRNARVCLVDDNGARASLTALFLRQMGWRDAVVLAGGLEGQDLEASDLPEADLPADATPPSAPPPSARAKRIAGYEQTIAQRRRLYDQVLRDGTLSFRPQ